MEYALLGIFVGLLLGFLKYVVKPIVKGVVGEQIISALLSGLPREQYMYRNYAELYKYIDQEKQYTLCVTNSPGVFLSCKKMFEESKYIKCYSERK